MNSRGMEDHTASGLLEHVRAEAFPLAERHGKKMRIKLLVG